MSRIHILIGYLSWRLIMWGYISSSPASSSIGSSNRKYTNSKFILRWRSTIRDTFNPITSPTTPKTRSNLHTDSTFAKTNKPVKTTPQCKKCAPKPLDDNKTGCKTSTKTSSVSAKTQSMLYNKPITKDNTNPNKTLATRVTSNKDMITNYHTKTWVKGLNPIVWTWWMSLRSVISLKMK